MNKYIFLLIFIPLLGHAQQEGYLSLSDYQMTLINPAYAGADAAKQFTFISRNQWAAIDDGPKTIAMAYSMARNKNVGLGLSVISDAVFIEKQTLITIDFSYKLKLDNEAHLYLGIKAGINSFQADTTPLIASSTSNDPAKVALSRLNPNFGVGFLYKHKNYWISAAIPKLFNTKRDGEIEIKARNRTHIYLGAGRTILVTPDLALEPVVMYRKTTDMDPIAEGILWGKYRNKFKLGVGIRTAAVVSFKTSVDLNERLSFSYAYDAYGNSQISSTQLNAHELGLRFRLNSKNKKAALELNREAEEEQAQ